MALKPGDRVQIVSRPVTSEDEKSALYFSYFGGLTGAVDRVYDDGTVCVNIELESLDDDIRKRHLEIQEAERKKWLENLSGEVRNRLTPEQRQLAMAYKLLLSQKDLEPTKGGRPKPAAAKSAANSEGDAEPSSSSDRKGSPPAPDPERPSSADLATKEEEYLRSLQGNN